MLNDIWFEELNFVDGKIDNFIYATEYENKTEYMKCARTHEYDGELGDFNGVVLIFN